MSEKKLGQVTEVSQDQIPNLVHRYIKNFTHADEDVVVENELETVDMVKNDIKAIKANTERKKYAFINDIKRDLGKEIKDSKGVGVKRVEKPKESAVMRFLRALFTKF